jgi:hypothetical protein
MPQTAQDWFTDNAPPQAQPTSGGDWFSDNAPSATPATPVPPKTVQATRPEQIPGLTPTVKTGQGPMPGAPVPLTTAEQMQRLPDTFRPPPTPSEHLTSLSATLKQRAQEHETDLLHRAATGGPQPSFWEKQKIALLHQAAFLANIGAGAMSPTGALATGASVIGGAPVAVPVGAYYAAKDLLTPRQPNETLADVLERHGTAAATIPLLAGGVAEGMQKIPGAVRSTTRNLVGASPEEIAGAQAKVGEETADVAQRNQETTAKATLANQNDVAKAQAKYNEDLAEHEGAGGEAQQRYQQEHAQWEQDNTAGQQKVEDQRRAETARQEQRKSFDEEANAHAKQAGAALDQLQKNVEADVKASWPKTPGVGDADRISSQMQKRAGAAMRESGPIPSPIARIIDRYTPQEAEGELPPVSPDISGSAYQQLKDEGVFTDEELAAMEGTGESAAEPNFENLQSQYSAMGKMAARSSRLGDRVSAGAYGAARDVLGEEMKKLSDAAGTTEQFQAAQQKFKTMARTFYNKTGVSRAIGKYRETVGSLQDHADPGAIAAPWVRQILASDPKVFDTARAQLSQFQGAPLDELEAMRSAHEQFKSVSGKPKVIPDYAPKPEPQLGSAGPAPVHEQPVPAHVGELEAPPEPFNKSQFIKGKMTQTGERFQHLSPWELRIAAGGVGSGVVAGLEGHPGAGLAAAGTGLLEPAAQYGAGALLKHPGFQEWVAREPGQPLGQPGTVGAQGNPTPFNNPPPSSPTGPSSPATGPGPSTPPPSWATKVVQEGTRKATGDFFEQRGKDVGPPQGTPERRVTSITSAMNKGVEDRLQKFGITHQPLDAEMGVEWQMILEDMRAAGRNSITRAQRGLAQDAMNSWNRGTFTAEETANRIRSALGLGSGAK